ncbi:hypothetical protein [Salibacterium sp. K-3]
MNLQPPLTERGIAAAGYGIPLIAGANSLFSVKGFIALSIILGLYFFFRTRSRYAFHHLRQSANVLLSYYLIMGLMRLVLFLMNRTLSPESVQQWLSEQPIMQFLLFLGGGMSSLFFLLLVQTVFYVTLVLLVLFVLFGKWTRVPFAIRFLRKDMHELG